MLEKDILLDGLTQYLYFRIRENRKKNYFIRIPFYKNVIAISYCMIDVI